MTRHIDSEGIVSEGIVGKVLLFRESPKGGSHSESISRHRVARMLDDGIGPDELYDLLIQVAVEAGRDFEHMCVEAHQRLFARFERAAKVSDSLSLHAFVQRERDKYFHAGDGDETEAAP